MAVERLGVQELLLDEMKRAQDRMAVFMTVGFAFGFILGWLFAWLIVTR